jgi:hypothetical protein
MLLGFVKNMYDVLKPGGRVIGMMNTELSIEAI